jgi:predicted Zn-dependent protease
MQSLEEIADQIKKHPKLVIADDFEIVLQRAFNRKVEYQDGALVESEDSDRLWVGLRILHRKRGARSAAMNPGPENYGWLVESAFEGAHRASVDPWFRFPIWKTSLPTSASFSEEESGMPASLYPEVASACAYLAESYDRERVETYIKRKAYKNPLFSSVTGNALRFAAIAERNGRSVSLQEERAASREITGRRNYLNQLLLVADQKTHFAQIDAKGKRKVVLGPKVVSLLLQHLVPGFLADSLLASPGSTERKQSDFQFSPVLSLVDDGSRSGGFSFQPFDLEGVPTQRTVLVEKGEIKARLFDVYSATRENRLSTGSYRKAPSALYPKIQAADFYFEPGSGGRQSLFQEMGQGYFWDDLSVLEPLPDGDFYLRGHGWRVAMGEVAEPVKPLEAKVCIETLFRGAARVAEDLEFYGSYGSPSIFFEEMPLGT